MAEMLLLVPRPSTRIERNVLNHGNLASLGILRNGRRRRNLEISEDLSVRKGSTGEKSCREAHEGRHGRTRGPEGTSGAEVGTRGASKFYSAFFYRASRKQILLPAGRTLRISGERAMCIL